VEKEDRQLRFIHGLQHAWLQEQAGVRLYTALARDEPDDARRQVLMKLADIERQHGERWAARLRELGASLPPDREALRDRVWRWLLVQSGTDNALKRIESAEDQDASMYASLAELAPTEADREAVRSVQHDEEGHSRVTGQASQPTPGPIGPQMTLDVILHRESWHRRGGGWVGQAIYGANDGLGAVFGIVSGVAGPYGGPYPIAGHVPDIESPL
jgi:rubrerythrin